MSADCALGLPINIALYSTLTSLIAKVIGIQPYRFIWTGGDTHLYLNQIDQAKEQVQREPLPLAKLWINPNLNDIFKLGVDDVRFENYVSHPAIKYKISV